jgi:aryl-alcohol dehydrogenase-like predicted oxidoreductase
VADTLRRAHAVHPITALQTAHSLWTPNPEIAVLQACRELGASVALAWLLHQGPDIIPIPGTTSPRHLEDNLAADRLVLSADQLARLDAALNARTVHGSRYNTATQAEIDTEEFAA